SVFPLHELISESRSPFRRVWSRVGNRFESQSLRLILPDNDCEGIVEAERFGPAESETRSVCALDRFIDLVRVRRWHELQYSGQSGAGIFDIGIDLACDKSVMTHKSAAEVQSPIDFEMRFPFDLLSDE